MGIWPIRTEMTNRYLAQGTNALASSDDELEIALKSGLD